MAGPEHPWRSPCALSSARTCRLVDLSFNCNMASVFPGPQFTVMCHLANVLWMTSAVVARLVNSWWSVSAESIVAESSNQATSQSGTDS
eukprot:6491039-Amphidinium_carterae.3